MVFYSETRQFNTVYRTQFNMGQYLTFYFMGYSSILLALNSLYIIQYTLTIFESRKALTRCINPVGDILNFVIELKLYATYFDIFANFYYRPSNIITVIFRKLLVRLEAGAGR